jgi:hypothetical protein
MNEAQPRWVATGHIMACNETDFDEIETDVRQSVAGSTLSPPVGSVAIAQMAPAHIREAMSRREVMFGVAAFTHMNRGVA